MKFIRKLTSADLPVADQIEWELREAEIEGAGFKMKNVEVPKHWSQTATNILAQKYLRKAGVPQGSLDGVETPNMPSWLWPRAADKGISTGSETSARQVFHRLAGCWTYWGWREGYFKVEAPPEVVKDMFTSSWNWEAELAEVSANVFYDELYFMLAMQYAAPNSPQWFNTGLHWAYGIEGPDSGQWFFSPTPKGGWSATEASRTWDETIERKPEILPIRNSYERPQVHACFIQPVADALVGEGGMLDLWAKEARLFKHGSGTGTNFSNIRAKGEPLSGGGQSSGVMSFLRVGDSNAGSIKSGGVTRRAAKMVVLDLDHPEIEAFIDWKAEEEFKSAAMYVGSQLLRNHYMGVGDLKSDPTIAVPPAVFDRMEQGLEPQILKIDGMEAEAIASVDGQNSNNSVRIPDEFLRRVDGTDVSYWGLTNRTDGTIAKVIQAPDLWLRICRAAWACGDPGLQFSDTMNTWHTCKADGEIRSTNPCSEYNFLDNTACNLASLNLCKFLEEEHNLIVTGHAPPSLRFYCELFEHAVRLWTIVLDISVSMASYPSREIAEGSYNYRTLGLGYTNLGGLLARLNLSYDSDEGRDYAASVTALMHFAWCATSNELAIELGCFPRYKHNEDCMVHVLAKHRDALLQVPINKMSSRALGIFNAIHFQSGFRNAQGTLLAPTGTIALLMDCDTTGVEPYFSPQSTKQLAGGGTMSFAFDIPESECAGNLSPEAHIKMVAAVQPFLSGGVSKTVNLPHSATVEDVSNAYRLAHKLGLKSISIYRDGSKLTQPLASTSNLGQEASPGIQLVIGGSLEGASKRPLQGANLRRGEREPLPPRRRGYTQKLRVGNQALYLHVGEYEPSGDAPRRLGEVFVDLSREGSTVRSLMESLAKAISIGLQFGVPLSEFVDAFVYTKFDPSGIVQGGERIKFCSSLLDLIFRYLGVEYLGREDLAHVPSPDAARAIAKIAEEIRPRLTKVTVEAPPLIMQGGLSGPIDACQVCGSYSLRRTGTCITCDNCGDNSGCS